MNINLRLHLRLHLLHQHTHTHTNICRYIETHVVAYVCMCLSVLKSFGKHYHLPTHCQVYSRVYLCVFARAKLLLATRGTHVVGNKA